MFVDIRSAIKKSWNHQDQIYENSNSIPSGKLTKDHGKSQCLMGKSTISMAISIAMLNYQRVN